MQIRPVGVKLFRVDRWTDMAKQIVAFCSFANSPKKCSGSYWQACSNTGPAFYLARPCGSCGRQSGAGPCYTSSTIDHCQHMPMLCGQFHLYTIGTYVMIFAVDCTIQ